MQKILNLGHGIYVTSPKPARLFADFKSYHNQPKLNFQQLIKTWKSQHLKFL